MTRDELEFSISQYHDGTLPALETRAIEEMLATNAQARDVLAEYQRLDAVMKAAPAMPELDWDRVHAQLSHAVHEVPDEDAPAVRTYKIGAGMGRGWTRYVGIGAAIAAALAIVATVVFRNEKQPTPGPVAQSTIDVSISPPAASGLTSIVSNDGHGTSGSPAVAIGTTNFDTAISVGPSQQVAGMSWGYDDGVLQRPARVVIAGDASPAQDGGSPIPD